MHIAKRIQHIVYRESKYFQLNNTIVIFFGIKWREGNSKIVYIGKVFGLVRKNF